ncbi:replication initiator [Streptomyces antibioticus]
MELRRARSASIRSVLGVKSVWEVGPSARWPLVVLVIDDGTGQAEPLASLPVRRHARQMIRTAWALGHLPEFADLKLWKWAHMLGFRGHFSSKSRAYSTTLGALRDVRRAWRTAQAEAARIRAGPPGRR